MLYIDVVYYMRRYSNMIMCTPLNTGILCVDDIRGCYLLCETLIEHPTSGASKVRHVGLNNNISDRSGAKGTAILSVT